MLHAEAPTPVEAQINLPDGRVLSYAEYGNPAGRPVFYFHGTPGSRLERPPAAPGSALGPVRLIVPDRPGYGRSTFQRGRRLLHWPTDIEHLADALSIARFSVVGVSGGGPHAAACAYALPHRLTGVALVSSLAPTNRPGGLEGLGTWVQAAFRIGRYLPWILHPLMARLADPREGAAAFEAGQWGNLCASDQQILGRPEVGRMMSQSFRESARQGVRAYAQDVTVFARPWGFDLGAIVPMVHLWHGASDTILPSHMGYYLAANIPRTRFTEVRDGGHFMVIDILEQVFAAIAT